MAQTESWTRWVPAAAPAIGYGLRVTAAVSAALFIAFYLQVENASWAGTSAAIVCQPVLGASLRKGVFRLVGTTVGAVATMVLTAWFPQDRVGFLVGLALWCAACSFVSTLLKNFAAYAAMLAGYTMVIIASSSIAAPDQVFILALSRATEIGIGIVCGMVVMSLSDLGGSQRRLSQDLSALISEIGAGLVEQLRRRGAKDEPFRSRRRGLIARVAALDPVIDQTIGESPVVGERRTTLRAGVLGLYLALSAWRTLGVSLERLPADDARTTADALLSHLPAEFGAPLKAVGAEAGAERQAAATAAHDRDLWRDGARAARTWVVDTPTMRLGADRIASLLDGLSRAANALVLVEDSGRALPGRSVPKHYMPDLLPPLVNAGRVFVAVGVGALFYVATSWSTGPTFITFLAVTVLLQSPRDEAAVSGAIGFGAGTALTAIVAAVVKFAILPNHETYGAFVLIIGVVLVPMAALSTVAKVSPIFVAATMNFIPLLSPSNQISYDTATYYNNALAIVGGSVAGTVMLRIMPPVSTRIRARRLLALTLRDLRRLVDRPGAWSPDRWRSRVFARLTALPPDAAPGDGSCLLSALTVGLQVLDLSTSVHGVDRDQVLVRRVQDDLGRGNVTAARETLRVLKDAIGGWPPEVTDETTRLRLQASTREILDILKTNAAYFGAALA